MSNLKKILDNTPQKVYNICIEDGEGFDLSPIPFSLCRPERRQPISRCFWNYYSRVKQVYDSNPSLFPTPPVFSGGVFRSIVFGGFPGDIDLFFNSYGMEDHEAEDALCLFLHKLSIPYEESCNAEYAGIQGFRVFNCYIVSEFFTLQAILKDMGPPQENPLYVTEDFHYNHAKAALSIEGPPLVYFHGHAVAGWEHKIHVQYRDGGFDKIRTTIGMTNFKLLNLTPASRTYSSKSGAKHPKPFTEGKILSKA